MDGCFRSDAKAWFKELEITRKERIGKTWVDKISQEERMVKKKGQEYYITGDLEPNEHLMITCWWNQWMSLNLKSKWEKKEKELEQRLRKRS